MSKVVNNIVGCRTMRKIQSHVLNELADYLTPSFGPNGSNTCIKKENALSRYTKDGHTIVGAIHYNGIIEQSIKDDVESITRHIVKTVGDGTTSAVLLSAYIFDRIVEIIDEVEMQDTSIPTADIVRIMERAVATIKDSVKDLSEELTPDLAYDIAMISTNGNEYISTVLKDLYAQFGNGVFIDVFPALNEQTTIKSYDGMTLNTGYANSCYITNQSNNTAEVDKPEVYFFEHPIDTRELGVYFDAILSNNIFGPVNNHKFEDIVPTVIFAPMVSQDVSSTFDQLNAAMSSMPVSNRLPVCIITSYHETEQLHDLAMLCGAKMIRKYIDAKIYEADVKAGKAPTPENIRLWAGSCDRVVSHSDKTVFINPSKMYNPDGSYSNEFENLVAFVEAEIKTAYESGDSIKEIGTLKRRLNSLNSNMVELYVGGITQADRDSLKDLVEDAVLNIRSAGQYGVGYGANIAAATIAEDYSKAYPEVSDPIDVQIYHKIMVVIADAYTELVDTLYNGTGLTADKAKDIFRSSHGSVYNIRTKTYDKSVRSSVMSDMVILDTVSKIIGIMATCNQFIVPSAMHNIYTV